MLTAGAADVTADVAAVAAVTADAVALAADVTAVAADLTAVATDMTVDVLLAVGDTLSTAVVLLNKKVKSWLVKFGIFLLI